MAQPTLRDVAAAAGVSVATASYALNGKGRVDPGTRARIRQVATRLGYAANPVARGLRHGRTSTIGLLLGTIPEPRMTEILTIDWYGRVTTAAAQAAFEAEHGLLLLPAVHDPAHLRRMAFDGLIVADPADDDPRLDAIVAAQIPAVALGRDPTGRIPHQVAPDTEAMITELLDHLAGQGATRILALTPDMPWEWTGRSVATYQGWCARHDQDPYVVQVPLPDRMSATNVTAAAQRAARRVLQHDPPDAILALCLGFAPGVLAAARELGLRVPQDLLLAQDADEPPLRTTDPPVTAVELFPEDQARAAVTMLIDLLRGDRPATMRTTGVELRSRSSSRRHPGTAPCGRGFGGRR